jgi:putative Holliday junction resolvase
MQRIVGLDVGEKTIGVALSDPLFLTAQGLTTIRRTKQKEDIAEVLRIAEEQSVIKIVVGLPKNMNNTYGPQSQRVISFAKALEKNTTIPVVFEDERLTTVAAERMLIESNVRRGKRKKVIDEAAATFILQTFLDRGQL